MTTNINEHISAISLSNISNGTLLSCCRNSVFFSDVSNENDKLDAVRQEWRDYLLSNFEIIKNNCGSWIDSWMMFLRHKELSTANETV